MAYPGNACFNGQNNIFHYSLRIFWTSGPLTPQWNSMQTSSGSPPKISGDRKCLRIKYYGIWKTLLSRASESFLICGARFWKKAWHQIRNRWLLDGPWQQTWVAVGRSRVIEKWWIGGVTLRRCKRTAFWRWRRTYLDRGREGCPGRDESESKESKCNADGD